MKAFKSFRAWMHRAFAAIVKTAFPTMAVKYFTIKTKKNPADFLPGEKKELEAIKKLGLTGQGIKDRFWSPETRMSLIRSGEMGIIENLQSDKEFEEVLRLADGDKTAAAMSGRTPSKPRLQNMLEELDEKMMSYIIRKASNAFSDLEAWEFLGVKKNEPCENPRRWHYAAVLVDHNAKWAPKILSEIAKYAATSEAVEETFKACWERIYADPKLDISSVMDYLYKFRPYEYLVMRKRCETFESMNKVPYIEVMMPWMANHFSDLRATYYSGDTNAETGEILLSGREEAYRWRDIALANLADDKVFSRVMDYFWRIEGSYDDKKAREDFYWDVYANLNTPSRFARALEKFPQGEWKERLAHALVECSDGFLEYNRFFPFEGWAEADARKAVVKLIQTDWFPMERMLELSPELQKQALDKSEVKSELAAINSGAPVVLKEIVTIKLHPEAESSLLEQASYCLEYKETYIQNFELSDQGFKALVTAGAANYDDREKYPELIIAYASKWGLNDKKYQLLLDSRHKALAPQLKKYLKSNAPKNGTAIVLTGPDDDEVPCGHA